MKRIEYSLEDLTRLAKAEALINQHNGQDYPIPDAELLELLIRKTIERTEKWLSKTPDNYWRYLFFRGNEGAGGCACMGPTESDDPYCGCQMGYFMHYHMFLILKSMKERGMTIYKEGKPQ